MTPSAPPSIRILGCRVDAVSSDEVLERIAAATRIPGASYVVTLGVEMIMYARRDARFHELIDRAMLSVCDTIGILLASRLRAGPVRERVTGVALIEALAARSARLGDIRLYLFGGAPGVAERAAAALNARYPGVRIAGCRNGYDGADDRAAIVTAVAASGANILLVGLGSPKQEFWLAQHLAATECSVGIGVGGSFDVIAGMKMRAPRVLQRAGLEWLYRLVQEPSRWRRQLALPQFAIAAVREAWAQRGSGAR